MKINQCVVMGFTVWLFAFLKFSSAAQASSLGFEYENFGPAKSGTLKAVGSTNHLGLGWMLSVQQLDLKFSPLGSTVGGVSELKDRQSFFRGGLTALKGAWSFGFNYEYGRAAEDQLSYHGPSFDIRYALVDWSLFFGFSSFDFVQKFDGLDRVIKGAKPVEGSESRRQDSFSLGGNWQLEDWIQLRASGTKFFYSKDIRSFATNLETYHGTSSLLSGLQNPLVAFNDKVFKFTTSVKVEEWLVNYDLDYFMGAVEDVTTLSHSIALKRGFDFGSQDSQRDSGWTLFGGAGLSVTDKQVHVGAKSVNFYFLGLAKEF